MKMILIWKFFPESRLVLLLIYDFLPVMVYKVVICIAKIDLVIIFTLLSLYEMLVFGFVPWLAA